MKITVAVPSYNYVQFLPSCLDSILMQDHADFEILVADGGSTDGSQDVIAKYCSRHERVRLVSSSDEGQSDAVRKAFQHASGDVLCFLNADDCYLCKDALRTVVDTFAAYPSIDLVTFGGYYVDAEGRWVRPVRYRFHPLDGFHLMKYRTTVLQPATFWRRSVYDGIEWPMPFHYSFDSVFFYKVFAKKSSWLELPKPVAGYRIHGGNKSVAISYKRILDIIDFETIKFGPTSPRVIYLRGIAANVRALERMGSPGAVALQMLYRLVNSASFLSVYRLPSI